MRCRLVLSALMATAAMSGSAAADESKPVTDGRIETVTDAVRVTIVRVGGTDTVRSVSGGGSGAPDGCSWSVVYVDDLDDATYGTSAGPRPHPDARLALLLCDGTVVRPLWIAPDDVVDVDASAADLAERYIEDVLEPAVEIGVNPAARGLVGLDSWFWIDGFDGSVTAPPITAFGLTIEVRMSSGSVEWDFGDGTVEPGDLGREYPAESTVRHVHQHDGTFTITASIDLVPEYRVDGGPWSTLPSLQAVASTDHVVEEREAVITKT
jgi:hypothetical protein